MSFDKQSDMHKKKAGLNAAVALCLVGFAVLVTVLSLVKMLNTGAQEAYDHAPRPSVTEASE